MGMNSLRELLVDQLKDIYNAEHQLVKALPKMSRKANAGELKEAIDKHLAETKGQIARLDQVADELKVSLTGKKCKAMEGLIEEGREVIEEEGAAAVVDAALIAAAQRVEHYEISAYGSARAIAEQLGLSSIAKLLDVNLEEESAADESLTEISVGAILPTAAEADSEAEPRPTARARTGPSTSNSRSSNVNESKRRA